jgi:hypothetical protein
LFVASLIVALIILWLYHAIVDVGKQVYRSILPSAKNSPVDHLQDVRIHTAINDARTPWGWKSHETPANVAKTHVAKPSEPTPWGWPGNGNKIREHGPASAYPNGSKTESELSGYGEKSESKAKQKVGWPYREDEFEFAGKAYKVTRKRKVKKTNLRKTGKPWGW